MPKAATQDNANHLHHIHIGKKHLQRGELNDAISEFRSSIFDCKYKFSTIELKSENDKKFELFDVMSEIPIDAAIRLFKDVTNKNNPQRLVILKSDEEMLNQFLSKELNSIREIFDKANYKAAHAGVKKVINLLEIIDLLNNEMSFHVDNKFLLEVYKLKAEICEKENVNINGTINAYHDVLLLMIKHSKSIKQKKRIVFEFIKSLPDEIAVPLLELALDKKSILGKIFWTKRWLTEPSPDKGILKEVNLAYKEKLEANEFIKNADASTSNMLKLRIYAADKKRREGQHETAKLIYESLLRDSRKNVIQLNDDLLVEIYLKLGNMYFDQGLISRSEEFSLKGLYIQPKNIPLLKLQAAIYASTGKKYQAFEVASKAIELHANSEFLHGLRGKIYAEESKYAEAYAEYTTALLIAPEADIYFERYKVCIELRRYTQAVNDIITGLQLQFKNNPDKCKHMLDLFLIDSKLPDEMYVLLVEKLLDPGSELEINLHYEMQKKIDSFNRAVKINVRIAEEHHRNKKYNDEVIVYTRIISGIEKYNLQNHSDFADLYLKQYRIYLKLNKYEEAKMAAQKYLALVLSSLKVGSDRSDKFFKIIKHAPSALRIHFLETALNTDTSLGKLLQGSNIKMLQAELDFCKNPKNFLDKIKTAKTKEEVTSALRVISKMIKQARLDNNRILLSELYSEQCYFYNVLGQFHLAFQSASISINYNINNKTAYNNRAFSLRKLNRLDEALDDLNRACLLPGDDCYPFYNRGIFYAAQAKFELAIIDFNKAIEFNPEANTYIQRAACYTHLGQIDQAKSDYCLAMSKSYENNDYPSIKKILDAINIGNLDLRIFVLTKYIAILRAEKNADQTMLLHAYESRVAAFSAANNVKKVIHDHGKILQIKLNGNITLDERLEIVKSYIEKLPNEITVGILEQLLDRHCDLGIIFKQRNIAELSIVHSMRFTYKLGDVLKIISSELKKRKAIISAKQAEIEGIASTISSPSTETTSAIIPMFLPGSHLPIHVPGYMQQMNKDVGIELLMPSPEQKFKELNDFVKRNEQLKENQISILDLTENEIIALKEQYDKMKSKHNEIELEVFSMPKAKTPNKVEAITQATELSKIGLFSPTSKQEAVCEFKENRKPISKKSNFKDVLLAKLNSIFTPKDEPAKNIVMKDAVAIKNREAPMAAQVMKK